MAESIGACGRGLLLAALAWTWLPVPSGADATATEALASLKSSYEMSQMDIRAACAKREKDALKHYRNALDAQMAALRQKGDLDAYLVVEGVHEMEVGGAEISLFLPQIM
jgi:hypothetical protein